MITALLIWEIKSLQSVARQLVAGAHYAEDISPRPATTMAEINHRIDSRPEQLKGLHLRHRTCKAEGNQSQRMRDMDTYRKRSYSLLLALALWAVPGGQAQEQTTGWRKFGESRPTEFRPADSPAPSELTLPAGSWITIRVNEPLSSDHNQPGDFFSATLVQPLVANGRVIARRGQTVGGRVVEAQKAGRSKGVSRLGLELTELSLVDGLQVPVKTQLIERRGDTSVGTDAAAIGTATGVGAAIGAAADGGFGAGMGAIAGAAVSTIGVLATRGRATVVYPETALTFRLEAPLTVATERAYEAFQPVMQADYEQRTLQRAGPRPVGPPPPYPVGYYPPYYYGPGFYGPGLFIYGGPRFYGRGPFRHW